MKAQYTDFDGAAHTDRLIRDRDALLEARKELEAQVFDLGLSCLTEEQREACAKAGIHARAAIRQAEQGSPHDKKTEAICD